jgi:hypothetical protein
MHICYYATGASPSFANARDLRRAAAFLLIAPTLAALSTSEQNSLKAFSCDAASPAESISMNLRRAELTRLLLAALRWRFTSEVLTRLIALLVFGMLR